MKILFLGTHGQKNWGDELMLRVFVDNLDGVADRLYINSYEPALTKKYLNHPKATVFNTKSDKIKLLGYLMRCDALVFGGGNILKELYTAYGGSKYSTLTMIDTLTKAAKLAGKPIYLSNIGIGPIETERGRSLAKGIVNRARVTSVRDSESFAFLESIQPTSVYTLASDAVFSTDRSYFDLPKKRAKQKAGKPKDIKKVGLSLCRNIANNDNWGHFIDTLAADLRKLCEQHPKLQIVGIPMQFDVDSNDDEAALGLVRTYLRKHVPNTFTITKPKTITELAHTIDQLDVLVSERLHAMILSVVLEVPVVALEYDVKVKGVVHDLGLTAYAVDINKKFSPGAIARRIERAASHDKDVTTDLRHAYTVSHAKASESFTSLTHLLQEGA